MHTRQWDTNSIFQTLLSPAGVQPDHHHSRLHWTGWRSSRGESSWELQYNKALACSADQPVFVLGDFTSCNLSNHLPTVQQYVDCPTRLKRTLDHCYGNICDAYKAPCRPPLGKSGHNVIHLLPKHKSKELKQLSRKCKCGQIVIKNNPGIVLTQTGTSSLKPVWMEMNSQTRFKYCEDCVSETKAVEIFPNNKPWVTKQLKTCFNEKKTAFCSGNLELMQEKKEATERKHLEGKNWKQKENRKQVFQWLLIKQTWAGLGSLMGENDNYSASNRVKLLLMTWTSVSVGYSVKLWMTLWMWWDLSKSRCKLNTEDTVATVSWN